MSKVILHAAEVNKSFADGSREIHVLQGLNFSLEAGQSTAIIGSSGSGKSTLLQLLAGLDHADSGDIQVAGKSWQGMSPAQSAKWRNQHLGFVFQFHHLLAEFDAVENVALPAIMAGVKPDQAKQKAAELLARVGDRKSVV